MYYQACHHAGSNAAFFIAFTLIRSSQSLSLPSSQFSKDRIKSIRCGISKSLAVELHLEVLRHNLNADGEEQILDSTEAACLGVVRNYTVVGRGKKAILKHSPEEERMANGKFDESTLHNALLVKHVCEIVVEEVSMELSETVWRSIQHDKSPNETANELCEQKTDICTKVDTNLARKKERKLKKKQPKKAKKDSSPPSSDNDGILPDLTKPGGMEDMFQKLDRDGTITNLLQQEKDNPEMMLPEEEQKLVRRARKELLCPICVAMLYGAEERARNTPGGRSLRSEADLSTIMDTICDGPPDQSGSKQAMMLGITPPNLPPRWTDYYKLLHNKKTDNLSIKSRKKPIKWKKTANRRSWSSKFNLEKIILTASCKAALATNEDVLAENLFHVLHNHLPSKCLHVKPGEIGKGYKEARGDECTMNPGVLHEVCKKVGHCDTFVNSNVIMEKTKAKGKPNRKDGNNGLEDL